MRKPRRPPGIRKTERGSLNPFHGERVGLPEIAWIPSPFHGERRAPPISKAKLMVPPELQRTLEEGLSALSRPCSPDQLLELVELSTLLEQWSGRMNLTGHRSAIGIAKRLVLDAAALLDLLPSFERLADLGSGAGFPGLPLAILEPEREFVLVEARERRHYFQREAIRSLRLRNVTSLRGRFEELEPLECGAVVAQAVAPPAQLIDAMLRWARPGASLLIPGGPRAPSLPADPRIQAVRTGSYRVPPDDWARSYWLGVRQPALS